MITNADITIYNRKANPETGQFEYARKEIRSVHWYTDQKIEPGEKGLKSADVYKIRIPGECCKEYIPSEEYVALGYGSHTDCWTVNNGDLFVKGIVTDEIVKLSDLAGKHYVYGQVLSYADNRFGTLPHIRIGGGA